MANELLMMLKLQGDLVAAFIAAGETSARAEARGGCVARRLRERRGEG